MGCSFWVSLCGFQRERERLQRAVRGGLEEDPEIPMERSGATEVEWQEGCDGVRWRRDEIMAG
ncbi:hypothetical protein AMTR_s00064p00128570 [Amborella trichopoda]|uniref:Uncharacterized protein n=1 Tax=Amborella trichopoda TaxID=13333 RepID=U5DC36_AMBTC|nr:hypothetical protein AMTR_s00064p00128570 [Amborella trichopoda]